MSTPSMRSVTRSRALEQAQAVGPLRLTLLAGAGLVALMASAIALALPLSGPAPATATRVAVNAPPACLADAGHATRALCMHRLANHPSQADTIGLPARGRAPALGAEAS